MNTNDNDMNDERYKILIQRELDGMIQPEELAELHQALEEDEQLATYYGEERQMAALLIQDKESIEVPLGLAETLGDRIFSSPSSKAEVELTTGRFFPNFQTLARAACVLLLAGAAFWGGRQSVQASSEVSLAGLALNKQILLEEHPELDPTIVDQLFDSCLSEIGKIDNAGRKKRNAAFASLEEQIEKLVLKARHKDTESK